MIPCHFKILDLKTKKFKDVLDAGNLKLNFTKNAVFKTRALHTKVLNIHFKSFSSISSAVTEELKKKQNDRLIKHSIAKSRKDK